jgi:hypothetical protein
MRCVSLLLRDNDLGSEETCDGSSWSTTKVVCSSTACATAQGSALSQRLPATARHSLLRFGSGSAETQPDLSRGSDCSRLSGHLSSVVVVTIRAKRYP